MRTKNAKRLWPVPATLAVVAVAALLAFGFLAVNGAQPAAAQEADCTVTIMTSGNADTDGVDIAIDAVSCDANGDTATIKLVGPANRPGANAGPIAVYVLAEDDDGSEDIYPNGTFWQAVDGTNNERERGTFYDGETGTDEEMATSYAGQNVTVPRAVQQGTKYVAQSTIVTVGGEGTVHIYLPDEYGDGLTENVGCTDATSGTCDADDDPSPPSSAQMFVDTAPGNNTATVTIRFLGAPALGEDLDTDLNDDLDDEILVQCVLTDDADDADAKLLGEAEEAGDCSTHPDKPSDEAWVASTEIEDAAESRSKLVVSTSLEDVVSSDPNPLIDGTTLTHMMDDEDAVTIYAVIQDAEGQPVEDTEVSFSSTTTPSGIVPARDLMDEGDAETLDEDVAISLGLVAADVVVAYELTGLAKEKGPYSIEVEVMAGDLNLGTVTITRADAPEKIVAGVFNAACFPPGGTAEEPDYEGAFNAKNKGCDASGMASRFGAGEMIFVKAHLEDSLDNVVGESDDLDSELADEFDDPLIDGDPVEIENPVSDKTMPKAWIYTVDEDAQLGDHMITVSTSAQNADEEDIDDVTVTVSVAGPPVSLSISGDANIELNGSVTYTVTAEDMKNGIPYFDRDSTDDTDRNDMVTVSVQPTDALVVGTNTAGQVMLDDNGEATFIVYAALDAEDGDHGRIIARLGELQDIEPITFGLAPGMPGMPMNVMAMADGHDTINVSWESPTDTGNSDITGYMVQSAYMMADDMMSEWMEVDPAHMGTDMMYKDSGLMPETKYYYQVAAINAQGMGDYSDGMAEGANATTEEANMGPMAGDAIDPVMLYVGGDSMTVSTTLTDPEGDTLTYAWTSSDEMVATVMADEMDMSMATIMPVGEGPATITVTATDAVSGMSESQEIMVTVGPAPLNPVAMYVITVPSRIEAGMTGSIMITAQDADGALGAITADNATINVSLSGDDEMITVFDLGNNQLELGTDDSMGSFRIFAKADATSGSVTITVIGEPGVATVSEMVRIGPNQNPMAGDDIADQMVLVGGTATVESTLSDHEGDDLTYTVSSSDDMIATATNDGAMITITGVAAGDATITVTGMDTEMGRGMQTIMVTVKEPNTAPMAGDAIDDVTMTVGDDPMKVATTFTDAEDDMLSYSAMSDDEMVATAMVDMDGMVTITAVGAGDATITVTATDIDGAYAMQTIMVTVMMMPPMELGDPSITSVMSEAEGMATVMLMPGDNATKHYIWAQPTDLSQGMYSDEAAGDADMVTISGLTSGMNYWFIAVAGRGTGADSEWSDWSGWTTATPIQ